MDFTAQCNLGAQNYNLPANFYNLLEMTPPLGGLDLRLALPEVFHLPDVFLLFMLTYKHSQVPHSYSQLSQVRYCRSQHVLDDAILQASHVVPDGVSGLIF